MKTLTMYRPNIQNAMSDFDRYLESFFGDSLLAPAAKAYGRQPLVDIQETESAYVLEVDLPGCDEKNIEVQVDGSNLSIVSKQDESIEKSNDKNSYILRERRVSSFSRSFKLPENANAEAVSAVFKNGVLTLQINKRAEAQKRTIQINAA